VTTLHRSPHPALVNGSLNAAISNAIAGVMRSCTGRGPTKARTTIHDATVFVLLQDTLTTADKTLIGSGRRERVLEVRRQLQLAMQERTRPLVEQLTGRTVIAMMADHHLDPDLALAVFVLDDAPGA
jgi:uncharacterized protein YbcI